MEHARKEEPGQDHSIPRGNLILCYHLQTIVFAISIGIIAACFGTGASQQKYLKGYIKSATSTLWDESKKTPKDKKQQ